MTLREFFFPKLTRAFLIRLVVVAAAVYVICKFVMLPVVIDGESMLPTYSAHGFNFCNKLAYQWSRPKRGDIVVLRYGGMRWMLLKRVIAFAGETVAFEKGVCIVDGKPLDEPYVRLGCDWNLPPHLVGPGCVYVMGDNRSVPAEAHVGGEIAVARIVGRPLW
jgi:signal peptidase I